MTAKPSIRYALVPPRLRLIISRQNSDFSIDNGDTSALVLMPCYSTKAGLPSRNAAEPGDLMITSRCEPWNSMVTVR